jgi:predicted esterase
MATTAPQDLLPHSTTQTLQLGATPQTATHAAILLHGRGGAAPSIIIQLRNAFPSHLRSRLCILAPAAQDRSWYPQRLTDPNASNEWHLHGAMARVEREIQQLEACGIQRENIMLGGFSQGACIAAKFIMTYPARYWGVFILSGAVPGLAGYVVQRFVQGDEELAAVDLRGTRVFVGCGDSDPLCRSRWADLTAEVLSKTGAIVNRRIYPGMGHVVCDDERNVIRSWVAEIGN